MKILKAIGGAIIVPIALIAFIFVFGILHSLWSILVLLSIPIILVLIIVYRDWETLLNGLKTIGFFILLVFATFLILPVFGVLFKLWDGLTTIVASIIFVGGIIFLISCFVKRKG